MSTTYPTTMPAGGAAGAPALASRVSWGALIAGALIAVSIGTALNVLGLAVGATTVDAVAGETPSAGSIGLGAGIWLLCANLIGLAVGGYVAARLAGIPNGTDAALHGLGVWAIGFLISVVLLGSAVAGTAQTAFNTASSAFGGVARGAGSAIGAVTDQVDPQAIIDRARQSLTGPTDPAQMNTEQRGAELATLLGRRVANGELDQPDQQRLTALIAAEAGIPQQEAEQRVRAYEAEAKRVAAEAEARARRAADAAASSAATASFWVFAALVLGALAAVFGAYLGRRTLEPTGYGAI